MRSIEESIEHGWRLLQLEIPDFLRTGSTAMKVIVASPEQHIIFFVPDPRDINDGNRKSTLFRMVREEAKARNADMVMVVSDAWIATEHGISPEKQKQIAELGLPRAHALGLTKKTEALIARIELRGSLHVATLTWQYYRDINNKILMGEKEVRTGMVEMRMNFFRDEPAGHA